MRGGTEYAEFFKENDNPYLEEEHFLQFPKGKFDNWAVLLSNSHVCLAIVYYPVEHQGCFRHCCKRCFY